MDLFKRFDGFAPGRICPWGRSEHGRIAVRQQLLSIALAVSGFAIVAGGALGATLVASTPAAAQAAAGLTGEWMGGYISADTSDVNTFDARLVQVGSTISGTMVETNAFGDQTRALFLTSTVTGAITGRNIVFIKTYDGSGGQTHTVSYRGVLEPNGRRIRGVYDAGGATGTFEMAR